MKTIFIISIKYLLACLILLQSGAGFSITPSSYQQSDTSRFLPVRGKIVNALNGKVIIFASVYITGTNIGTVANSEGKFLLKIPVRYVDHLIGFSSMGYKPLTLPVSRLSAAFNTVKLEPAIIPIPAVVIEKLDPVTLLREAIKRIPENYGVTPAMMTAFYRESVRKGNKYLSVGEAVLNVYKASYKNMLDADRVQIYKGRKGQYVRREDTVMLKLQGGPVTAFYLDIAKRPGDILSPDVFSYYDYSMGGFIQIDGRKTYIIRFDQKDTVSLPLYKGIIYLDAESLAIVSAEFEVSPKQREKAVNYLIIKNPNNLKIDVLRAAYLVNYRLLNGKWVLNYMRLEDQFRCKWVKKLFRSNYTILSEAAVTDVDYNNVVKPRYREALKWKDAFTDKVSALQDKAFWGANNVIQPEESIQSAIAKISRKLKRHK